LAARFVERFAWLRHFDLFEAIGAKNRDLFSVQNIFGHEYLL
jgi:hypothetical protein